MIEEVSTYLQVLVLVGVTLIIFVGNYSILVSDKNLCVCYFYFYLSYYWSRKETVRRSDLNQIKINAFII